MNAKARLVLFLSTSGLFLLLDQLFKYIARTQPLRTHYLFKPWLGWEYLGNTGVAFSLPFPNIILVIFTPLIILGLFVFWTKKQKGSLASLAILFIIAGALSNWIDRIIFGLTVDYIRIFTGVINLADVMIIVGIVLLLFWDSKKKTPAT